jgi:hypothetical protein
VEAESDVAIKVLFKKLTLKGDPSRPVDLSVHVIVSVDVRKPAKLETAHKLLPKAIPLIQVDAAPVLDVQVNESVLVLN